MRVSCVNCILSLAVMCDVLYSRAIGYRRACVQYGYKWPASRMINLLFSMLTDCIRYRTSPNRIPLSMR